MDGCRTIEYRSIYTRTGLCRQYEKCRSPCKIIDFLRSISILFLSFQVYADDPMEFDLYLKRILMNKE